MPNRLLTLMLCLLVLLPQQFCACHWVGCHGSSVLDHGNGGEDAHPCDSVGGIDPAPAATHAHPGDAPGCSCGCHSYPGGYADCSHAASDAVIDPPKPAAVGHMSDLSLQFFCAMLPPAERFALLDRSHPPPRARPVPLYLTFCSLRN